MRFINKSKSNQPLKEGNVQIQLLWMPGAPQVLPYLEDGFTFNREHHELHPISFLHFLMKSDAGNSQLDLPANPLDQGQVLQPQLVLLLAQHDRRMAPCNHLNVNYI